MTGVGGFLFFNIPTQKKQDTGRDVKYVNTFRNVQAYDAEMHTCFITGGSVVNLHEAGVSVVGLGHYVTVARFNTILLQYKRYLMLVLDMLVETTFNCNLYIEI